MEIISDCKYRPDYRNFWPWKRKSADAAGTYTGVGSIINLYVGDQKYMLDFLSSDVVITHVENGYLTFHPTDKKALDKLASYMKAHGEKKKI